MDEKAIVSVEKAKVFGRKQNQEYIEERLVKCKSPIYERTNLNKLSLYCEKNIVCSTKGKMNQVSLIQEKNLCTSMFVACQMCDCNFSEFFEHQNHNYPSSISA